MYFSIEGATSLRFSVQARQGRQTTVNQQCRVH